MQKIVLSLDIHDDQKCKQKAMKIASCVQGVNHISLDINARKLTLVGNMDVVEVVTKLRKAYRTTVLTIGPEPDKSNEKPKKEEPKKEQPKKQEPKNQAQFIYEPYPYPPRGFFYY